MIRATVFGLLLLPLLAVAANWGVVQQPVADRSVEARNQALSEGLGRVLVRLTGDMSAATSAEAQPLLQDAGRWARQFSYLERSGALFIQADFDVPALSRAAQQGGLPVWSLSRPEVLVWLVTPGAGRGEVIGSQSSASYASAIREAADERGFPLLMPQWDADDQSKLQPADIRGQFDREILDASRRYAVPFVVTAVYSADQIRWRVLRQGQSEASGVVEAGSENVLFQRLIDQLVEVVSPRYIVKTGNEQAYQIEVRSIKKLGDWRTLERYLSGLSGVTRVRVVRAEGEQVLFGLHFSGGAEQLQELVSMHSGLSLCEGAETAFCWQGH